MNVISFAKCIIPEVEHTDRYGDVLKFGLQVGRQSMEYSIWSENTDVKSGECYHNKLFDRAVSALKDGATVCVLFYPAVSKDGKLALYIRDIVPCDPKLKDSVNALFIH